MEELPILRYRKQFADLCRSSTQAVVLVSAATGSGKTTQLPQFLLDDLHAKRICVTQPRRVAAITLAKRVSFERKEPKFGQGAVGYRVRFQNQTCGATRLIFSTDGLLVREAMHDPMLSNYDFIVLDEVHERSLNTDLLFGVVKRALATRNAKRITFRVVVMSATVDLDLFQKYFSASVLLCEGRQHPVDVLYLKEASLDRVQDSIRAVLQVHADEKLEETGGILLFLSGKEEIESVCRALEQTKLPELLVCALHASLPHELQLRAFERAKPGMRKIVVSTNVAETSVTVDGIQFVIDSGVCKVKRSLGGGGGGMKKLSVVAISKSQAVQRAGRAGRELPGKCFRLYPEDTYEKMLINLLPEIQRVDLAEVVMQLLALGVSNLATFDFLQRPDPAQLKQALATLTQLHAISIGTNGLLLTERGKQMSEFPLEPVYAALLLSALGTNCVSSMCGIVAMECGVELPFFGLGKDAQQAKKKWISPKGDHFTALHLLDEFESCGTSTQRFCRENFCRLEVLNQAKQARAELVKLCNKFTPTSSGMATVSIGKGEDEEDVIQCLVKGTVSRIAKRVQRSEYEILASGDRVFIHPSCSLSLLNLRPDFVVFDEILVTSKTYLRGVSGVSEALLASKSSLKGGVSTMEASAAAAKAQLEKSNKRRERSWAID
ncbi:hypothetical protein BASA81_000287 [Batrachochytrium salamandrivorans]|nr:hypothetical protein BASA81_000287 [Batrachochytrium salamandrivorans]